MLTCPHYHRDKETGASPANPSAFAAAGETSITRPRTNGPRSEIRTTTLRPLFRLVIFTRDPDGNVRWAAVMAPGFMRSPLALLPSVAVPFAIDRGNARFCQRASCERDTHGQSQCVSFHLHSNHPLHFEELSRLGGQLRRRCGSDRNSCRIH